MPTIQLEPNWDRKLLKQLVSVSGSDERNSILCEVQAGQRVLNLTTILAPIQMRMQLRLRACDCANDFYFVLQAPQFCKAIIRRGNFKAGHPICMKIGQRVVEVHFDDKGSAVQLRLPLEVPDTATHQLELLCLKMSPTLFRVQMSEVLQWSVPTSSLAQNLRHMITFIAQTKHERFDYQVQIQGQRLRVVVEGKTVTAFTTLDLVAGSKSSDLPPVTFALNGQQIAQLGRLLTVGRESNLILQYQMEPERLHVLDDRQARLSMDIVPHSVQLNSYELMMTTVDVNKLPLLDARLLLDHVQLIAVAKHEQKQLIDFLFVRMESSATLSQSWNLRISSLTDGSDGDSKLLVEHDFPDNTRFCVNAAALQHALDALVQSQKPARWCVLEEKSLVLFADDTLVFMLACQPSCDSDGDGW